MANLHIRDVPAELYERLSNRAREQRRPLNAEVIELLREALERSARTPEQILAKIEQRNHLTPAAVGAPSSTTLLREDRER
jgi:plasmid stability protein